MASQGSSHASVESMDEITDERKDIKATQLDVNVLLASLSEKKCLSQEQDEAKKNKLFTDVPLGFGDQSSQCKQKEILNEITIKHMAQNATKEMTLATEQSAAQNTRFNRDFEEIEKLGRGGFGKVFKARHKLDGQLYAVKMIYLKPNNKAKPLREVKALACLKHENIIGYITAWTEDNGHASAGAGSSSNTSSDSAESTSDVLAEIQNEKLLYIQMELCNCTLQDWLQERNENFQDSSIDYGPEDLRRDVIRIFREILCGVSFIHSMGFMHRDLKPLNIFLKDRDQHVKIGDFGFVKGVPGSGSVLSSPTIEDMSETLAGFYVSPELLERRPCDTKCDMYSLGMILFEMCNTFTTGMERHITMTALKEENQWPESFIKMWSESEVELIDKLISYNADCRPTAEDVLRIPMFAKEQKISAITSSCIVPVSVGSHGLPSHMITNVMDQACGLVSTSSQSFQTLPEPVGPLNQGVSKQDQKVKKLEHKFQKQDRKVKKQDEKVQEFEKQDQKFQKQDQKVQGDADQLSGEATADESIGYRRKQ